MNSMILERFPDISNLPPNEKRLLITELCEQLADAGNNAPDPAIVAILEAAHQQDSSGEITLEEFRERLKAS